MKNREIRREAWKKSAAKGITPVVLLIYAPTILISICNNADRLSINIHIHWAVWYLIQFAIILFSYAGGARAVLAAWERGEARVRDLVAYFTNWRLLLRALVVALFITALTIGLRYAHAFALLFVNSSKFAFLMLYPLLLLGSVCANAMGYLYYAIELAEGERLWRTILRGIDKITANIFRIVGMQIALWWWVIILLTAVLVIVSLLLTLPPLMTTAFAAILMALVYWLRGAYIKLAHAGLALEIFRGAGADAPEEAREPED